MSGIWESNPHLNLGRVVCYHCTNSASEHSRFANCKPSFARTQGLEPWSSVLETDVLPLNYGRMFDQVQGIEPWIDLIARQAVCFIIGLVLLKQINYQFADILPGCDECSWTTFHCIPTWNRTKNLRIRNPLLYPVELSRHFPTLCPDSDSNRGPTD